MTKRDNSKAIGYLQQIVPSVILYPCPRKRLPKFLPRARRPYFQRYHYIIPPEKKSDLHSFFSTRIHIEERNLRNESRHQQSFNVRTKGLRNKEERKHDTRHEVDLRRGGAKAEVFRSVTSLKGSMSSHRVAYCTSSVYFGERSEKERGGLKLNFKRDDQKSTRCRD